MTTLLIDPHGDDGALFASFLIQKYRPVVAVVLGSEIQPSRGAAGCSGKERLEETIAALDELHQPDWTLDGKNNLFALNISDLKPTLREISEGLQYLKMEYRPKRVIYPSYDHDGHDHHNLVNCAARRVFNEAQSHLCYTTYTRSAGRTRTSYEVVPETGEQIARKHKALACFASQMQMDPKIGCWPWFMGDMKEYLSEGKIG